MSVSSRRVAGRMLVVLMLAGVLVNCTNGAGTSNEATTTPISMLPTGKPTPTSTAFEKPDPEANIEPDATDEPDAPREYYLQSPPAQGWQIQAAQERLLELGYSEVGWADGIFGEQMDAAIRHFQFIHDLPVDGILDNNTHDTMFSNRAMPYRPPRPYPGRDFSRAEAGSLNEVQLLQERLVELGYLPEKDQDPGKSALDDVLLQAITEFHGAEGFASKDGLDLRTWSRLFSPLTRSRKEDDQPGSRVEANWKTSIYPLGMHPVAMAFDGSHIWALGPHWENPHWTVVARIDPQAGPLEAVMEMSPAPAETMVRPEAGMVVAGRGLWMLVAVEWEGQPRVIKMEAESGEVIGDYEIGECQEGFCFPSAALGFDGKQVWASASDRVWAVDPVSGKTGRSQEVGFLASGPMVSDGTCLWMRGESGLTIFNPRGGSCVGGDFSHVLPGGPLAFDGRRIWSSDGHLLYSLDLATKNLAGPFMVGSGVSSLAYDGARLWVALRDEDTVVGIQPDSGEVVNRFVTGREPAALVHDGKDLWIACSGSRSVQQLVIPETTLEVEPYPKVEPAVVPPFERNLYLTTPSFNGKDVQALQERLMELGYTEVGIPDGIFGRQTDAAVRKFQGDRGLVVDGVVGPLTWEALFQPE